MPDSVVALLIGSIAFICFAFEIFPLAVTAVSASILMAVFGIISFSDAFLGFSNDMIMLLIGVSIISGALFETGVAEEFGEFLRKNAGKSEKRFLIVTLIFGGILSGFITNSAVVAMFVPMIASVTLSSGGKITKKNTYMPLAFIANAGGMLTMVGAPPQIIAQAILLDNGYEQLPFFFLSVIGIPIMVIILIFYTTIGYNLQAKVYDFNEITVTLESTQNKGYKTKNSFKYKRIIPISVLIGCIVCFILKIFTLGTVAIIGGIICIVTGCISEKKAYKSVNWSTVFIIAGSLGFSLGLLKSGCVDLIVGAFSSILGTNPNPYVVFVGMVVLATFITSLVSNVATTSLLTPIAIGMGITFGINIVTMAMGVAIGAGLSFATPISSPQMALTLSAGYRFKDYVKMGSIMAIICLIVTFIIIPIVLPL